METSNKERFLHPAPEGSFSAFPTAADLAESLKELLEIYWGEGDGEAPPFAIMKAKHRLAAFERDNMPNPTQGP
jgi:hypothetical protein